jgi:hypothetical protein
MAMSPDTKATITRLRSLHIPTERDRALAAQLDRLLQTDDEGRQIPLPVRFTCDLETRGITFIEAPGGGKTTAARKVLSSTTALNPVDGPPLHLRAKVPSPASLKSLGLEILRLMEFDGISARATAWQIWDAVRHRLSHLGIVVLWIDEAHDLFLCHSAREIEDILKMLKSLMQGETAVILLLSGTGRLADITSYDPQVNRRFTKVVPKDLVIGADEVRLSKLVRDYAREADLTAEWSDAFSSRLIHGSRRRFGRAVETIINAIEQALAEGNRTLTGSHFAEAWGMQEGCAWDENVFVRKDWASMPLDGAADEFDAARSARQRKQLDRS